MNLQKTQTLNLKVVLTQDEKTIAKSLAKSKGYSFQGWIGQLIKTELKKAQEVSR